MRSPVKARDGVEAAFELTTLFIGANMTPANRQVRGAALGIGLLVVGFEFEYADTTDNTVTMRDRIMARR